MRDVAIECNPDEALVRVLGCVRKEITHQPGKGDVARYLEKNLSAIGMVDEDPGATQPSYFNKFRKSGPSMFDIDILVRNRSRVIVIKPRLEEWIIKYAIACGVDPKNFSLPNNGNDLHKVINSKISKFTEMLEQMKEKESPALKHLLSLL